MMVMILCERVRIGGYLLNLLKYIFARFNGAELIVEIGFPNRRGANGVLNGFDEKFD